METFSVLLALLRWIPRWTVNSPHKGQWRGALMFSLICAWIKHWVNSRVAVDLRRHRAPHDVNVMATAGFQKSVQFICSEQIVYLPWTSRFYQHLQWVVWISINVGKDIFTALNIYSPFRPTSVVRDYRTVRKHKIQTILFIVTGKHL